MKRERRKGKGKRKRKEEKEKGKGKREHINHNFGSSNIMRTGQKPDVFNCYLTIILTHCK
ncbi:hypothetical protein [Methanosarcina sp. 2.H.A.1B.4]|uniref:hypothetical protein n=1 Tax=Methanosarcina sp. 2.H.A.1B.4 TaxID=1483600 RepID=UPI000621B34C|nr:hypothetical protein [Methanosarcina sp. 2.H.A.1B.4]KKG08745.1 hypothetical protein EO92_13015 [Methanosarcina sp. 2.H.A.1B.4]